MWEVCMVLLGEKIKRLRNSQNMTQTELAERLNITKSTVSSYENDSRLPSYDVLIKMAQLFNVTIDSLLMDERKGVYFDIDYMTDEQVAVISQLIDIFRTTNMRAGSMCSLNKQNRELIDKSKTEIK